jgi:hypothetical protein
LYLEEVLAGKTYHPKERCGIVLKYRDRYLGIGELQIGGHAEKFRERSGPHSHFLVPRLDFNSRYPRIPTISAVTNRTNIFSGFNASPFDAMKAGNGRKEWFVPLARHDEGLAREAAEVSESRRGLT